MAVNYLPKGYHTVTPYLTVNGAQKLIEFIKTVFDATLMGNMVKPDGTVSHAEMKIGDSIVMIADAPPEHPPAPPYLYVYVKNTDSTYKRALQAGALSVMEPATQFYGDRNAGVRDASGCTWWIATHLEDVSTDELQRRANERLNKK
ncbi:MAG: VOC family protein [Bacteroidota bacterium]